MTQTQNPPPKRNPFSPDLPVEPARFAGRRREIAQIETALREASKNNAFHIMIQGPRWIGKSSLAAYAESIALAKKEHDGSTFSVFCRLGSCCSLEEMCIHILDEFKRTHNSTKEKIFDLLKSVSGLKVGPIGVTLDHQETFKTSDFPRILEAILENLKGVYQACLIILDETERISGMEGVAHLLKDTLEHLSHRNLRNVCLLMTSTTQGVDNFTDDHGSFPRLFRYVDLKPLAESECAELVKHTLEFGTPQVTAKGSVLQSFYHFSDGFPGVIQEIGHACFEVNSDSEIDDDDFILGLIGRGQHKGAIATLFDKHFRGVLSSKMQSERYREILVAAAKVKKWKFSAAEIKKNLKEDNNFNIGPYMKNIVSHGVFEKVPGERGRYRFCTELLRLWCRLYNIEELKRR